MSKKGLKFELHKQEIIAGKGVIASNHPLASSAGVEMYAQGGNAFDAAIATLFALTVVEPMMVSVFGAGFFVVRDAKTGKIQTIDNYAVAPLAATDTMYEMVKERKPGQNIFETVGRKNLAGPLAVAAPGTLKAWEYINKQYGELDLPTVISPAIRLARQGYKSSAYMWAVLNICKEDMVKYPETSKTYLPAGKPVEPGSYIKLPVYAETLEKIAKGGSNVLYRGEVGREVAEYMEENHGIITMKDLQEYRLIMREPVHGTYRDDFDIYAMAPGSSGGTHIIQMLNILEHYDVGSLGFGSAGYLHLMAEVLKIAFADRQKYMGDPAVIDIPLKGLLSKEYAKVRAGEIDDNAKLYHPGDPFSYQAESCNTTHLSAMDSEGNIVAATQTLNGVFGSCVTVPSNGIILNNCMALFDPRPNRANSVAGGKRMLSSMSPTIILRKGKPYLCIGTPGGLQIFPSVTQAIVNLIDFNMSIQEAVEAPRIWTMGIKGTPGEKLIMEKGFPEETRAQLREKGHDVFMINRVAGGMNGVLRDEKGMLHGGACWRADGAPMGISGGRTKPELLEPNPPY
jgi:gamma-glutamyltranspeptidase/glutathione hydrolase